MNQKKKNPVPATKKLKHVKSQQTLPFGSLMQEISHLKQELKTIKTVKHQDSYPTFSNERMKVDKQNTNKNRTQLHEIECINRQYKLKMDIEVNKLRKTLSMYDDERISHAVNQIVDLFNQQTNEISKERNTYQQELEEIRQLQQSQRDQSEQKYKIIVRNNKRLQKQLQELRSKVIRIIDEKQNNDEFKYNGEHQHSVIADLREQLHHTLQQKEEIHEIAEGIELQCRALEEKCITYEKTLEKKCEELINLQQDTQYLRIESQKFKTQKRQIQKIWERSSLEAKETKKALNDQIQKLEKEKSKWMNECSQRRHESEQIQAIEQHRELLFKQIQQMRSSYTLKCKQLAENKSLLHDLQRKVITLQSDNFKMAQERQKVLRQNQYWEAQIQKVRGEVEEFHIFKEKKISEVKRRKEAPITANMADKKVREEKLKTLQDIHSLIRQHKERIDEKQ